MLRLASALVVSSVVLVGCGGREEPTAGDTPTSSPSSDPASPSESPSETGSPSASGSPSTSASPRQTRAPKVVGTVARGLEVPWGIAFLPDGRALVTERDSKRVYLVGRGEVTRVGDIDAAAPGGEAGLLGVAVSPTYDEDQEVFFYVTAEDDNRVLRTTFDGRRLGKTRAILTGIPKAVNHDGGRLLFGPDGMLYVATGDGAVPELAQDRGSLGGKILRITRDGEPAEGNPQAGSPVWSWGHRNVQGLAFDDAGHLWASEFGQDTWDELNQIRRGANYGWPEVEGEGGGDRFVDPQVQWATDDASPSGLAFTGGRLYMAALRGERLWRVDVEGRRASDERGFFVGEFGRMRTVVAAPDGNLWVTTSNRDGRGDPAEADDRILLVRP